MRTDVAAIVVGGPLNGPQHLPSRVGRDWPVIAADSGADLAFALGLVPTLVVGDLDSISSGTLARCGDEGIAVERAPGDKDETDLELAIAAARRCSGLRELVILGGAGGRLDHLLANFAVICGPATDGLVVEAWPGALQMHVVRSAVHLEVAVGTGVSLLAWHGDASGVTTSGLRWELDDAVLGAGSALGTSNVAASREVSVTLRSGVVSAVIGAAEEAHR